ncbi:hypothetical protein MASR1M32_32340 [Rhodobacter sp.]
MTLAASEKGAQPGQVRRPTARLVVVRPRLDALFAMLRDVWLTLVQAPAGFGKSTLLNGWQKVLEVDGIAVCRVDLHRYSRDVGSILRLVLTESVPCFAKSWGRQAGSGGFRTSEQELTAVLASMAELGEPLVILMDDAQFVPPQESDLFRRLVEQMPEHVHLPLARMRMAGDLMEVVVQMLRFGGSRRHRPPGLFGRPGSRPRAVPPAWAIWSRRNKIPLAGEKDAAIAAFRMTGRRL